MKQAILWSVGLLLALVSAPRAAAQAGAMQPGLVLVAKVVGTATVQVAGAPARGVMVEDVIPSGAVITTGRGSRVVLVFANGAMLSLGSETTVGLEEFVMEPLLQPVAIAQLAAEPTTSRTVIRLHRGEVVGDVKKLRIDRGSSFTVLTPVGAAGIRGTVFRVQYLPAGTGYALVLTTVSGLVQFGPSPAPGPAGSGSVAGVMVPSGQQLQVAVSVTPSTAGQLVVASALPAHSEPIPAADQQRVVDAAIEMVKSVEHATFAPAPNSKVQTAPAPRPAPTPLRRPAPTPGSPPPAPSAPPADLPKGPLSLLEAIRYFEKWGGHAVWADDLTEFTIDSRPSSGGVMRQYFEVQRNGAAFSVREISALTRPLIDHGILVLPPLNFTETAEMNAAYYRAHPGAVPGQLTIPPGGPYPRPPRPPQPGAVQGAPGTNVAGGVRTITINGVTSSGATFSGTVVVTPTTPSTPPPPPTPPRLVPSSEAPPRKTNPGG